MLWQRVPVRMAPDELLGGCRAYARQRKSRTALRVREPEQGWWDAHGEAGGGDGLTVAAVHDWDAVRDAEGVATRLAEVAVEDELLVVFGAEGPGRPTHRAMVAGLRLRLPRHDVIAMAARPELGHLVGQLLDAGSLPVVVTEADAMHDLTAELASMVRADRVVRVFPTPAGAGLYPVWRRPGPG